MSIKSILSGLGAVALTAATPAAFSIWTAQIVPVNNSGIEGTAKVESVGKDSTRATISISGAKAGSQLTWQIQSGACGGKGLVVGGTTAYPLLKPGSDGKATATATLPVPPPTSGSVVAQSEMKPVACGELQPSDAEYAPTPKPDTMPKPSP